MLKRLVAVSATLACLSLAACGNEADDDRASDASSEAPSSSESAEETPTESAAPTGVECDYVEGGSPAAKEVELPPGEATVAGEVEVVIETTLGDIPATLDADATPCTVNSFVSLAEQGFFDETPCHRLTTEGIFVLQCGDPTGSGTGGPGYTIPDEVDGSETYGPGTLAMAKTAAPDSGGSQFFLVYEESPLPPDYTVFGSIEASGLETLREIAGEGTVGGAPDGAPKSEVSIATAAVS